MRVSPVIVSVLRVACLALAVAAVACGGTSEPPMTSGAPAEPAPSSSSGTSGSASSSTSTSSSSGAGDSGTSGGSSGTSGEVPAKAVRFIAVGDTGTGDSDQKKVANAIEGKCKKDGCDFVQLLGDNLYDSGANSVNDGIWQSHFEIPYAAIDLDFYAVLGNHDYGHGGAGTDFPKGKNEIDYTNKSKKFKMPAAYFHRQVGPVEMIGLDTNMQMFGQDAAQKKDVSGWLAASTAPWKIAVGHHPYKSNGPHGNAGSYDGVIVPGPWTGSGVKAFMDATICGKVDLYLCGHDHSRQWLNESCQGTELAVSGAGAKATELPGTNPALFQSLELGFLYIVIDGPKLTAEFVDENGVVEFTHVIQK